VDYWNMNIKDAITTLSAQQIINNCYLGINDRPAVGKVPESGGANCETAAVTNPEA